MTFSSFLVKNSLYVRFLGCEIVLRWPRKADETLKSNCWPILSRTFARCYVPPITYKWKSVEGLTPCIFLSCPVLSCPALPCPALSCLVSSCAVVSCRVVSCRVQSCLVLSFLFLSCPVLSCPVLPYPVLSCLVLSCPVLSCPVLSCLVLSCLVLSCLVLSCPVLSCAVLSCPSSVQLFPFSLRSLLFFFHAFTTVISCQSYCRIHQNTNDRPERRFYCTSLLTQY